jgi:hypothetical protein
MEHPDLATKSQRHFVTLCALESLWQNMGRPTKSQ